MISQEPLRLAEITPEELLEKHSEIERVIGGYLAKHSEKGVFAKDLKGRYVYINASALKFVNKSRKDLIGYTDVEIFGRKIGQESIRQDKEVLEAEEQRTFVRVEEFSGKVGVYEITKQPFRLGGVGEIVGVVGVIDDITESYKQRQAQETNSRIYAQLREAVITTDLNGTILTWNKGAMLLYGWREEEAVGRKINILAPDDDEAARMRERRKKLLSDGYLELEVVTQTRFGKKLNVDVILSLMRDQSDNPFGICATHHDITAQREMERALKESERKYRDLFESSPDALFVSLNRKLVHINDSAIAFLGAKNAEEILGRGLMDFVVKEHHDLVDARVREILEFDQRTVTAEEAFLRLDGVQVFGEVCGSRISWEGEPALLIAVRDITKRREVEAAMHQQAAVLDQTRDAIIRIDLDGIIRGWNAAAEALYGWSAAEAPGQHISMIWPVADRTRNKENNLKRVLEQETVQTIQERMKKNGRTFQAETTLSLFRDKKGVVRGIIGVTRDVTDRIEADRELQKAKMLAESANKAKSEFLSNMRHELRTPLNAMMGYAQVLSMDLDKVSKKIDRQECLEAILQGGAQLETLIDGVLDFAKIGTGKMRVFLENVDANRAVRECLALVKGLAEDGDVKLNDAFSDPGAPLLYCDCSRLKQVLINLLTNAIKYNKPGGEVSVGWRLVEDNKIRIEIIDTGFGVSQDYRDLIFEPFERLGWQKSHIEGIGLGLSIAKQMLAMMAGEIGFESEEGKGSTFWLDLPISENQGKDASGVSESP